MISRVEVKKLPEDLMIASRLAEVKYEPFGTVIHQLAGPVARAMISRAYGYSEGVVPVDWNSSPVWQARKLLNTTLNELLHQVCDNHSVPSEKSRYEHLAEIDGNEIINVFNMRRAIAEYVKDQSNRSIYPAVTLSQVGWLFEEIVDLYRQSLKRS